MLAPSAADYALWIHVLAATVWIGGQITVAMLMPALLGQPGLAALAGRRFGTLAWAAFATLFVTGLVNIHNAGIGPADLGSTPDGRTLSVKLVLVAVSGSAAGIHSFLGARGLSSRSRSASLGLLSLLSAIGAALFGVVIAQN